MSSSVPVKIAGKKSRVQALRDELQSVKDRNEALTRTSETLQKRVQDLREKVAKLEGEKADFYRKFSKQVTTFFQDFSDLRDSIAPFETPVAVQAPIGDVAGKKDSSVFKKWFELDDYDYVSVALSLKAANRSLNSGVKPEQREWISKFPRNFQAAGIIFKWIERFDNTETDSPFFWDRSSPKIQNFESRDTLFHEIQGKIMDHIIRLTNIISLEFEPLMDLFLRETDGFMYKYLFPNGDLGKNERFFASREIDMVQELCKLQEELNECFKSDLQRPFYTGGFESALDLFRRTKMETEEREEAKEFADLEDAELDENSHKDDDLFSDDDDDDENSLDKVEVKQEVKEEDFSDDDFSDDAPAFISPYVKGVIKFSF